MVCPEIVIIILLIGVEGVGWDSVIFSIQEGLRIGGDRPILWTCWSGMAYVGPKDSWERDDVILICHCALKTVILDLKKNKVL